MLRVVGVFALVLMSCSDPAPTPVPDTEDPCECIVDESYPLGGDAPLDPTCGESLCAIDAQAWWELDGTLTFTANDEDITCALEALRDGTPGLIHWSYDEDYGYAQYHGYILIRGDGMGFVRRWWDVDLASGTDDAKFGELPDAEVFASCLARSDPYRRLDCVRDVEVSDPLVCDEGWPGPT